jgi:GDP-L-fucose synthase
VDLEIRELASRIAQVTDYQGQIKWDTSKPDGTPQKLLDVTRINKLGWTSEITLDQGLKMTYEWFVDALATENLR